LRQDKPGNGADAVEADLGRLEAGGVERRTPDYNRTTVMCVARTRAAMAEWYREI